MTVAILTERIAYRPLRGSPRLVPLITAIGASFFLQYTFRGLYGSGFKAYPQVKLLQGTLQIGNVNIPTVQLFVFFAALLLMLALYWLVERTRIGKAMRAVSENKEVARLMGIDIDWVILFTFGVGGFLAGSAGVINGLFRPQGVNFFMGFIPGIKAFTAAVLGGIGNIPGRDARRALPRRHRSHRTESGAGWPRHPPAPTSSRIVIAFTMLVLVLIFRPQGHPRRGACPRRRRDCGTTRLPSSGLLRGARGADRHQPRLAGGRAAAVLRRGLA